MVISDQSILKSLKTHLHTWDNLLLCYKHKKEVAIKATSSHQITKLFSARQWAHPHWLSNVQVVVLHADGHVAQVLEHDAC